MRYECPVHVCSLPPNLPIFLVFPTLLHLAEAHNCWRAGPKQRGKSRRGRWHDPLLFRRWDLRLSTRTRALFLRARRRRKFLARMLVFAHKHFGAHRPGYTLIQTCLGCFLPLPRSIMIITVCVCIPELNTSLSLSLSQTLSPFLTLLFFLSLSDAQTQPC